MENPHYYVHGDQVENNPHNYYCTMCDLFVGKPHFSEFHADKTMDDHLNRRAASYLYVCRMQEFQGAGWSYTRRAGVANVFDGQIL